LAHQQKAKMVTRLVKRRNQSSVPQVAAVEEVEAAAEEVEAAAKEGTGERAVV
jgi:hypothetical protein